MRQNFSFDLSGNATLRWGGRGGGGDDADVSDFMCGLLACTVTGEMLHIYSVLKHTTPTHGVTGDAHFAAPCQDVTLERMHLFSSDSYKSQSPPHSHWILVKLMYAR